MRTRSVGKRMLVPLMTVCLKMRNSRPKDRVCKEELLSYECVDLELEAQYKDVRRQLNEYDRSREPEVRGKWNRVCSECGYVNHERHRYCESCGCTLVEQVVHDVDHVCPKCRTSVAKHVRECHECGARFWSPIILTRPQDKVRGSDGP